MEFGITMQGHVPGAAAHDPVAEHAAFMDEIELVRCADRSGWKYAWTAEHHTLTEYSHLAASDVWMGYLAAVTERIHLGAGIFNLSPHVNHPVRNAERAALLDHLTAGRFEFGTGRGAGSHELGTFMVKEPGDHACRVGRGGQGDPTDVGAEGLHVLRPALHRRLTAQRAAQALPLGSSRHLVGVRQPRARSAKPGVSDLARWGSRARRWRTWRR